MLLQMANFLFNGCIIFHCTHACARARARAHTHTHTPHIVFILSSTDVYLGCFYILAIVSKAAMNIWVHIFFSNYCFCPFRYIPRDRIAGSYGGSIFSFLKNLHNVFHSDCSNVPFYQLCSRAPFSPHPCQHLLFVFF